MSNLFDQNGQYRRPHPHFSDEKMKSYPRVDRRQLLTGSALMMGLALLMILAMIPLRAAEPQGEPDAAQTLRDAGQSLTADCTVIQQLTYAPCGHHLTRRQVLPGEMIGKSRADLEAAYGDWQITTFAPAEVSMARTMDMFCPQHTVLLPDEGGQLCAWQNRYGDALALVKEFGTAASELPDSAQGEARQGKGFDSLEALEKWLESVGS